MEAEVTTAALPAHHSELVRLMSSPQQQVADAAGALRLNISQRRMPSLFGATPIGPPTQRAPLLASSSFSEALARAISGGATTSVPRGGAQLRPPGALSACSHDQPAGLAYAGPPDADSGRLTTSCTRSGRRRGPRGRSRRPLETREILIEEEKRFAEMQASKEHDKRRKTPEQKVAGSITVLEEENLSLKEQVQKLTEQVQLVMTLSQEREAASSAESSAEWQKPAGKQQ